MFSSWFGSLLWFLVIAVGGGVIALSQPALHCCLGFENCDECKLLRYAPMSWRAKTITAVNECPVPVAVAVTYRDKRDLPQTAGWQEVPAGATTKVHSGDGIPIVSYGPNYRYKVVRRTGSGSLVDPRRIDEMQTANIFNSPEAWWAETTRMRVACR